MRYDVEISTNIIDWVLSILNPSETNPQVFEILVAWQNGEKTPTYNKVLEISRATGIPLGYFFLKNPPKEDLSIVNYRTVKSIELKQPSQALKTTILDMELIQEWLNNQLITDGYDKNDFVKSLDRNMDISALSQTIRQRLGLEQEWFRESRTAEDSFKFLRNAISDSGIIVMVNGIVRNNTSKTLSIDEFRAFALVDDYAPLIFINTNDSINGRLFSLLHEYVHIGLGENSLYNDRCSCHNEISKTEQICNAVAAEILVPQEIFNKQWQALVNYEDTEKNISKLARYFKCGVIVIARKALENQYITKEQYTLIANNVVKNYKKNKSRGGDFYRSLNSKIDNNFLNHLISSVEKGNTLYTEAFRLTNTNSKTFNNLKTQFEGGF